MTWAYLWKGAIADGCRQCCEATKGSQVESNKVRRTVMVDLDVGAALRMNRVEKVSKERKRTEGMHEKRYTTRMTSTRISDRTM